MAITTLDGVVAGMRPPMIIAKSATATLVGGRPASLWSLGGSPGAGAFNTTLNGVTLSSTSALVNGQIPHFDPSSGNAYLARLTASASQGGVLMLMDRIWHNGGYTITSTAAQNSTTPTWPSRCPTSGTDDTPATTGHGVLLALEISAATGAGTPTITISYTNQAGTAGRTATNFQATVATSAIGATYLIGLQAGDTGVRSVQSLTLSATWTSGTMNLVAYRPLAALELAGTFIPNALDAVTSGLPRLYDGTVPWLVFVPQGTTASIVTGTYVETHG
ncbi:MAG: hypothetical protein ACRCZI_04080 [Cetobacterium sp.]